MFPSYIRIGGLREDLPRGFHEAVKALLEMLPGKIDEYHKLLTKNQIWVSRTKGIGILSREQTMAMGLAGPMMRAVGIGYDVRKAFPYLKYETFDFTVPMQTDGDVFARYMVRMDEMRQSVRLCAQALERITPTGKFDCGDYRYVPPPKDRVYTEMEALIQHFLIYSQGFNVPKGEACVPVEGPRGEQGFYVVSDGTNRPLRVKARSPSLIACSALPTMINGGLVADSIAVIGSTDIVLGDCDR
jgi:NADH-quinone oxidoreductase subunit D